MEHVRSKAEPFRSFLRQVEMEPKNGSVFGHCRDRRGGALSARRWRLRRRTSELRSDCRRNRMEAEVSPVLLFFRNGDPADSSSRLAAASSLRWALERFAPWRSLVHRLLEIRGVARSRILLLHDHPKVVQDVGRLCLQYEA